MLFINVLLLEVDMHIQVEPKHYSDIKYDSKKRFCSYWHQINEIFSLNPEKVLEIGIGNSFVSKYLKERGINILTLDIDNRLNPDVAGSVLDIPFLSKSFDVVACYELLEHLPFNDLHKALSEIWRVTKRYAILSLPDSNSAFPESLTIPRVGKIRVLITLPKLRKREHRFDGQHYWEIGKSGYPLSRISKEIEKTGFRIKNTYRIFEHPHHRMFILQKIDEVARKEQHA